MDPPTEIDVTIGGYVVNGLDLQQSASGFELPNQNGYEVVNLVQFNQGLPQSVTPVQVAPPLPPAVPPTAYRGVPWDYSVIR
jgi:hypothetical protein